MRIERSTIRFDTKPFRITLEVSNPHLDFVWVYKSHGGGVPVTFSPKEVERIHELIEKEPRRIRHAKAVIEEETKKKLRSPR